MAPLKLLVAAPLLLSLDAPMMGLVNSGYPPTRFMADASVQASFLSQEGIEEACGKPATGKILACVRRDVFGKPHMFLPNPNRVTDEEFRRLASHELGHVRGWSRMHED